MIPVLAHGSVRALLRQGVEKLRLSGVPSYALAAELLLLSLAAKDRTWLYSHPEEILPDSLADAYFALLAQRASGIPTQHLTGKQEFWGLEFEVTPELVSTEDFRIPYTLQGFVRGFNQELLEKDLIEEQLIFYTLEKPQPIWRFFDVRTHRSGRFDQEYLISLMERLV